MKRLKDTLTLAKRAFSNLLNDKAFILSAALSYYTLFSIAPLILIAISVSGLVMGEEASRGEIFRALDGLIGREGASGIQNMVESAGQRPKTGVLGTVVGVATLLIGASGVFGQLQDALNMIWKVTAKPGRGLATIIRARFLSFTMVAGVAFLLLVSLIVTAALAAVGNYIGSRMPGGEALWQGVNFTISFAVTTFLFAMIFKVLPDVRIRWRDVWLGAIFTSVLFTVGKFVIGTYIGNSDIASTYGAAASLIVVLIWFNYSSLILFFGAEYTRVHALSRGPQSLQPKNGAEFISPNIVEHPQRSRHRTARAKGKKEQF